MKIHVLALLITINLVTDESVSESDITTGYQVTLAVPTDYARGFVGRAFLIKTDHNPPNFRAAISVEAIEEGETNKYCCSLDVFLGEVRVWSSAHFSRFYVDEKCVLQLTDLGDLRLKAKNERVGWKSGTSKQGVKRLSLLRTGNLVLVDEMGLIKWQSFNFPTDIMVWGQRLSSKTRLTSFPPNSTFFYSMEIKDDKIELFLNYGKSKYSYWEYKPIGGRNITFVEVSSYGLEIFNGKHRYDQIKSIATSLDPLRFLSLENNTGNLRMYHYSEERGKFEASYQALNFTCDLPLPCGPYGICMPSGSCSCVRLTAGACNEARVCGGGHSEMVELQGVVSVLTSDSYKDGVGKKECSRFCNEDCTCVAAQYVEEETGEEEDGIGSLGRCFLYEIARGIKTIERGNYRVAYMVKVRKGVNDDHGKNFGLKKWVIIVVVVVDVFVILIVLGGVGYYFFGKRKRNLAVREQAS
ncbi:PAN domain-containing protein At5g03700-like [Salvia miltiorrhiza]|uniref:PAN domain-containing protein At5g03700-like n=1 Tax=Salvia miltiorrhiza TaxID=226208 RepID=UPI0025AD6466|nr:PAN domain-containing protein At5g03700-like [Salvia miltiorrhiza]